MSTTPALAAPGEPADPFQAFEFFRHHGVWAPGVRLFRRLQFSTKATLVTLMFLLPVATLGWSYFGDKAASIAFSDKERDGVAYVREVLPLLKAALQSPGAPSPEAMARLAAVEQRLGADLGTGRAHEAVRAAASATDEAGQRRRVEALVALVTQATDGSNLTLDPDLDTYYLMDGALAALPALADATEQLRIAAGAVAGGRHTPEAVRASVVAEVTSATLLQRLADGLPKIHAARPWKACCAATSSSLRCAPSRRTHARHATRRRSSRAAAPRSRRRSRCRPA